MTRLIPLAVAALLAGCPTGTPAGGPSGGASAAPVGAQASKAPAASEPPPRATKFVTFEAVVRGPAAVADKTGTGAALPWGPLQGAKVTLRLAGTNRPPNGALDQTTDAQGQATFSIEPPRGPVLIEATLGPVRLMRIYAAISGGRATLDPSTTLPAAYFERLGLGGDIDAIDRIDAPRLDGVATRVRVLLEADAAGVDLATSGAAAAAFEAMIKRDGRLRELALAAIGRSTSADPLPTLEPTPGATP